MRRSLVVWGWGQAATGGPRWSLLAALELVWFAAFAWFAPPLLDGSLVVAIFGAAAFFVAAWGAVAVHAYRRAVRRRTIFDLPGADGGAIDLLWLAPIVIVGMTALWAIGGSLARPEATLTRFVRDWRTGNTSDAVALFVTPPSTGDLSAAWEAEIARLRNDLVELGAVGGGPEGIDPDVPFESIRFVDAANGAVSGGGPRRVDAQIVRRETIRDSFFGLFPTTSQRLVPVADLGWIELRRIDRASGRAGVPDSPVWLIERLDLLGERYP